MFPALGLVNSLAPPLPSRLTIAILATVVVVAAVLRRFQDIGGWRKISAAAATATADLLNTTPHRVFSFTRLASPLALPLPSLHAPIAGASNAAIAGLIGLSA